MLQGRFAGKRLYVEQNNKYQQAAKSLPDYADELNYLGSISRATWFSSADGMTVAAAKTLFDRAAGALVPVILYFRPNKDNGSYSSGGAADNRTDYLAAVDRFIAGQAGRECFVTLEPDGPSMMCDRMSAQDRADTGSMLKEAARRLSEAGASVYIESGTPNWIPADRISDALEECGIEYAAGFTLNVSGTRSNAELKVYTREIRAIVGKDKGAVWDTGRNGQGAHDQYAVEPGHLLFISRNHPDFEDLHWKNAPGRGTGEPSTVDVDQRKWPGVDAFFYGKSPGGSDADDERGNLPPGGFDPWVALDLLGRGRPRFTGSQPAG